MASIMATSSSTSTECRGVPCSAAMSLSLEKVNLNFSAIQNSCTKLWCKLESLSATSTPIFCTEPQCVLFVTQLADANSRQLRIANEREKSSTTKRRLKFAPLISARRLLCSWPQIAYLPRSKSLKNKLKRDNLMC